MTIDTGTLESALAVAVGHDPDLVAELRRAFVGSVDRQVDLLRRSRCDANWQYTALRLKGLAASFDHNGLMKLAEEACACAPGDPVVLRKLTTMLQDLSSSAK